MILRVRVRVNRSTDGPCSMHKKLVCELSLKGQWMESSVGVRPYTYRISQTVAFNFVQIQLEHSHDYPVTIREEMIAFESESSC